LRCARCGGEIPEGGPSCPGCGLKVRVRAPGSTINVSEINLKTLKETDDEAEVEVIDVVFEVTKSGTTARVSLKEMIYKPNSMRAILKLKNQDGSWLIYDEAVTTK